MRTLAETVSGDELLVELERKLFAEPFGIPDSDLSILAYFVYLRSTEGHMEDPNYKLSHAPYNITLLAYAYGQFAEKMGANEELKEFLINQCRNYSPGGNPQDHKKFTGNALMFRKYLDEIYDIGARITLESIQKMEGRHLDAVRVDLERRLQRCKEMQEKGELSSFETVEWKCIKNALTHQTWPLMGLYDYFMPS